MAKETVTVSIETTALDFAKSAAKADNRSLSNYLEVLIMREAEKNKEG